MAHKHSVYDTDTHFLIDADTREISTASGNTVLIQHDHNSERFTFEIPRIVDGHDMSLCNLVQVHYLNIDAATRDQYKGVYKIVDLQISPDSEDVVIGSWLVSSNATQYVGSLNFIVRFACIADDGTVDYAWSTAIYNKISIGAGISNAEEVAEQYADIVAQWEAEFINFETAFENHKAETEQAILGKYDASNIEEGSTDLTPYSGSESAIKSAKCLYTKIGKRIICNIKIVMNDFSMKYNYSIHLINLPFVTSLPDKLSFIAATNDKGYLRASLNKSSSWVSILNNTGDVINFVQDDTIDCTVLYNTK